MLDLLGSYMLHNKFLLKNLFKMCSIKLLKHKILCLCTMHKPRWWPKTWWISIYLISAVWFNQSFWSQVNCDIYTRCNIMFLNIHCLIKWLDYFISLLFLTLICSKYKCLDWKLDILADNCEFFFPMNIIVVDSE